MIKKKYPANISEMKKLSQQAIKGVSSTKNHKKSLCIKINHNSRSMLWFNFVLGLNLIFPLLLDMESKI